MKGSVNDERAEWIVHGIDFLTFDPILARCLEERRCVWTSVCHSRRCAPESVSAVDAVSVVSDTSSTVSLQCIEHAAMRLRERRIAKRALRKTLLYGERTPARGGRLLIKGNGLAMIRDRANTRTITAYRTNTRTITAYRTYRAPPLPPLWEVIKAARFH